MPLADDALPAPPAGSAAAPDATGWAHRLCNDPGAAAGVPAADRHAVAWALKAACYGAWSSDPPQAVRAADALATLARTTPDDVALQALSDWTAGIAYLISSDMEAALRSLDRAATAWHAAGEPLQAAHAQVPRIMALTVLGRFDEALASALAAETALRAHGDELAAAKVRLNLGSLAFSRQDHAEAVLHYRTAAVRFARAGDTEHSVMADIGVADALSTLGRLDEARDRYVRARLRADAHGLPVLSASASNGSALLALSQGRYREALAGLEATRRTFQVLKLAHRLAEAEKSLADAYLELRLLPEAIGLYTELVHSLRAEGARATLPWALAQLAWAHALLHQPAAAWAALAEAADGFAAQRSNAGKATVDAVMAALHAAAGRPADAWACARRASDGFAMAQLPMQQAAARVQAAQAQVACGEPAPALAACEALLADTDLPPQVRVQAGLARADALLALGQRPAALSAIEAGIVGVEELRAALPGDDLRSAFLADGVRPYRQRLSMALEDASLDADGAARVLHWLERLKARSLQERIGRPGAAPAPVNGQEPLRERLDWLYRQQQRAVVEDDGGGPAAGGIAEAARLERLLLENARRERLLGAGSTASAPSMAATDVQALRGRFRGGRVLVEYGVVDDELFAVTLGDHGLRLHRRLAAWSETVRAVHGLRLQIDAMRAGRALPMAHLPLRIERTQRRLAQLHALIWRPLLPALAGCEQAVIVPHGELHGVPFAALGDFGTALGDFGTAHGAGTALVDRHAVVMAASAAVALHALEGQTAPSAIAKALVVGNAGGLVHVPEELRAVEASLGGVRMLGPADAGVAPFKVAAPQADLLHIACHALFRADSPLFSALHLKDGVLTAHDVESLQLRARLVVLSACESALGETGAVDEGVGLVRAFLMAGARSVLGSQWAVDDACTAAFVGHFYARWRAGVPLAEAVRLAQATTRERWPHPAHWAAFALHGAVH